MSHKKKRNKAYTGPDAAKAQPTFTRIKAVDRSPLGEWWHEHKRQVKLVSIAGGVVLVAAYLLFELIRLLV